MRPTGGDRGRQPPPGPGRLQVAPRARDWFLNVMAEQYARGLETYGTPLRTWNGRDPAEDAMAEAVDLVQYLAQLRLERNDLAQFVGVILPLLERALPLLDGDCSGPACTYCLLRGDVERALDLGRSYADHDRKAA